MALGYVKENATAPNPTESLELVKTAMKYSIGLILTGIVLGLWGLAGMALGGWLFWTTPSRTWWDELGALIIVLGFIFFGGGVSTLIQGLTASTAVAHVAVAPAEARLGETLTLHITLTPRRTLRAGPATLTLNGKEFIKLWSGHITWSHTAQIVHQTLTLAETVDLVANQPQTYTAQLTLPLEAMPTFYRKEVLDCKLAFDWEIAFRLRLPGSPDLKEAVSLHVLPQAAKRPIVVSPSAPSLLTTDSLHLNVSRTTSALGDAVTGEITWFDLADAARPRALRIELGYRTVAGKWFWEKRRWEHVVDQATLSPLPSQRQRFTLRVTPESPLSYDGRLYQITWFLRAVADRPWAPDLRVELPLRILPPFNEAPSMLQQPDAHGARQSPLNPSHA
ncbi:MAG: hypothetical protein D6709_02625 [Chloroflexi bacterium]|nr:MAG: hypothetical protein D6709_02625 [Chloroflexota bacterium]